MTSGNRIARSLNKLFGRKPATPAEPYQSWAMSSPPKATEPAGKDAPDAVDH
ncbi:MAG TPA: hypothetical protein VGL21_00625 [Jatrophihabitantaceae bacterium]|jgi:hypothetical protein